jgi:hypothetical protein
MNYLGQMHYLLGLEALHRPDEFFFLTKENIL